RRPQRPTSFPYTTLFRSAGTNPPAPACGLGNPHGLRFHGSCPSGATGDVHGGQRREGWGNLADGTAAASCAGGDACLRRGGAARSEEHTSELQSRENLVC